MKDKFEVEAGAHFKKTWTFRNDGQTAWPIGTKLVKSCGDNLGEQIVTMLEEVQPNCEIDFTVEFVAPMSEGKYTAYFRLQVGNIKFGQKVWCDIMVVKPKVVEAEPVKMVSQDNVDMMSQEVFPPEKVVEPQASLLTCNAMTDQIMTPGKVDDVDMSQ